MRIIAGSLKGRSIDVPRNFKGRPTTDFAREGLFNVLNNMIDWEGLSVAGVFFARCSSYSRSRYPALTCQVHQ